MKIALLVLLGGLAIGQRNTVPVSPKDMNEQFPEAPVAEYSTFKPHFFTKQWDVAEGVFVLSGVTDVLITLKRENPHTCLEGNNGFPEFVHAPELAGQLGVEVGFSFFVRWMTTREKLPKALQVVSYAPQIIGITEHTYGATRWYFNCK